MKLLFNDNWSFSKYSVDTRPEDLVASVFHPETIDLSAVCRADWQPVDIPHDWMIYDTLNLYENSIGCYRKTFTVHPEQGKRLSLLFEGVYMNTSVYVNGMPAGEWKYGYTSFSFDITELIHDGENTVLVYCVYQCPNSRWYSGAGIYRDVYLLDTREAHLVHDGIYISTTKNDTDWTVSIATELINETITGNEAVLSVRHSVLDAAGNSIISGEQLQHVPSSAPVQYAVLSCHPESYTITDRQKLHITSPALWDINSPNLYKVVTELFSNGSCIDRTESPLGFRTIRVDSSKGFFLNDRHVKLNGVCMHHDLGALGAAFNVTALRRQFKSLKSMGVNAIRTSHNPVAVPYMYLADEMGLLIISEAFDMWERPKTDYDYGHYFNDWYEIDSASWLRRDRNHPCLIMWSIGNEIYDTHLKRGYEIAKQLKDLVLFHDPEQNGFTTIGSNYIEWEGAQHCATLLDASGYNYAERLYEQHHADHPDWVIYGSETSSTVQSRSIYHFPASKRLLTHDDLQCSALGNCSTNWGAKNSSSVVTMDRDTDFSLGQFIWTGWDYIGEPTPYFTKNSYFGQVDTAGFEKDTYYVYQAEWTDYKVNPMVHILPYWDFNKGQLIDIRIYSNAPKTELFFNDISQGRYEIDHKNGYQLSGEWQLPYAPGTIKAVAYDENGTVIATDSQSSFGDTAALILHPDKTELFADGQDLIFVDISAFDSDGHFVSNARNRVEVTVSGQGRLVGLDNGDSTDYDQYKGTSRKLFGGKLLAIIAAKLEPGEIHITVSSPSLPTAKLSLTALPAAVVPGTSCTMTENSPSTVNHEIPVRKIELHNLGISHLTKECPTTTIEARLYPADNTYPDLNWKALLLDGIESNCIQLKTDGNTCTLTAVGDGEFRLCCYTSNRGSGLITSEDQHPEVISELELDATGLGQATLDPYGMVSSCLHTAALSEPKLSFQGGVFTQDERNWIQFDLVDFGDYGSDEITIPVFSFLTKLTLEIWEGCPDNGGELLLKCEYEHESIYNHYNSNTWKLPKRLRGIKSISIVTYNRISVQGFRFTRYEKAFSQVPAIERTRITGDMFNIEDDAITGIGNNVTLEFDHMNFGDNSFTKLTVCGRSRLDLNTIHVCFEGSVNNSKQIVEFLGCSDYTEQIFDLKPVTGEQTVLFIFLPGSNFDFKWFRFE